MTLAAVGEVNEGYFTDWQLEVADAPSGTGLPGEPSPLPDALDEPNEANSAALL